MRRPGRNAKLRTRTLAALVTGLAVLVTVVPPAAAHPAAQDRPLTSQVLIVGDSVGGTMVRGLGHAGFRVINGTRMGCRLVRGRVRFSFQVGSACPWPSLWRREIREMRPAAVVLVSGVWDLFDVRRTKDGPWLRPGTKAWASYYREQIEHAVDVLSSRGARVIMPTIPYQRDPLPAYKGSARPERVRVANAVIASVARRERNLVAPDLNRYLSPDGTYQAARDGVAPVRYDGVHFTPAGAELVGEWLAPHITPALGRAARPQRRPGPVRVALVGGTLASSYADAVAAKFAAKGYEVSQRIVPGRTLLSQELCSGDLARELRASVDPDVVVFEGTWSDAVPPDGSCGIDASAGTDARTKAWAESARRNQKILTDDHREFLWVLSPQPPGRAEAGRLQATNRVYRSIADDRAGYIDAFNWLGGAASDSTLWSDPEHLNAAGAAGMANIAVLGAR